MKKTAFYGISSLFLLACGSENTANYNGVTLTNEIDSVSYCLGANMASNIAKDFDEANPEAYLKGFMQVLDSAEMDIDKDAIQGILTPFFQKKQQEAMKKQQEEQEKTAKEQFGDVKSEGEKFLEDNKSKDGVQVTESGLQYVIMKEGNGKQPGENARVLVHYHGTTPDGTVFDSSVERGEPIDFNLQQVIVGWTEGLQLMKEGAKYKFFIPQELAYGANPRPGGPIKPFMPLVFEVELLEILD